MNLYEYQAKKMFEKFGLPVLDSCLCSSIFDIEQFVKKNTNNLPWVVKCQIRAGSRGLSGGVKIVHSEHDALCFANKWIGKFLITSQTDNVGEKVDYILIEPAVKVVRELYLSILLDRDINEIVCMVSPKGGVDVEKLIYTSSDNFFKINIDPEIGAYLYQGRIVACQLGLIGNQINQFVKIFVNIVRMFLAQDLTLVEINPLAIIENDRLVCLDAKVIIDHNALFRQSSVFHECNRDEKFNSIIDNNLLNINYVALDGNIGCMVNGAGLAMATMDLMKSLGGDPANFLDIGGYSTKSSIISAFKMLLKNIEVKVILINIFGGIVCCDLVADSIMIAVSECTNNIPIVVRLKGNNSVLGINRLINSNLNVIVVNDLVDAVQRAIELVK